MVIKFLVYSQYFNFKFQKEIKKKNSFKYFLWESCRSKIKITNQSLFKLSLKNFFFQDTFFCLKNFELDFLYNLKFSWRCYKSLKWNVNNYILILTQFLSLGDEEMAGAWMRRCLASKEDPWWVLHATSLFFSFFFLNLKRNSNKSQIGHFGKISQFNLIFILQFDDFVFFGQI